MEDAHRAYFFEGNKPSFRVQRKGARFSLVDEKEKIELAADSEGINRIHNLLKDMQVMRSITHNKWLFDTLLHEYQEGNLRTIAGKPYVVYDIETSLGSGGTHNQCFEMAYSIASCDEIGEDKKFPYRYVDSDGAKRYADYLLSFDGRVIWFNSISFDNVVLLENVWYSEEQIKQLHQKSLDPFLLLWKLTGRRMSLNNVASTLIGESKTLSGGHEGQHLLEEYKKTGNEKFLTKVKEYCRNDVHLTLWVVLYLLHYKNVMLDGQSYEVDEPTLLDKGGYHPEETISLTWFDF